MLRLRLAVLTAWLLASVVLPTGAFPADEPLEPPPPPLPRSVPGPKVPVVARPDQPEAFLRSVPLNIADLRKIEDRVRALVPELARCTVGIQVCRGFGSGVIVTADGYVLSAAHVTGAPNQIVNIFLSSGRVVKGRTLGLNRGIDASVVKITTPKQGGWPHRKMARAADVKIGDWCVATGHPGGFARTRPIVLRLGRVLETEAGHVKTDCTLVGGDSGGPLFDLEGHVIGIHSRIGTPITWNYHVPVAAYTGDWSQLLAARVLGSRSPQSGPVLGINGEDHVSGCRVTGVTPNLPAAKAGVMVGDLIVSCDGRNFRGLGALFNMIQAKKAGDKVKLSIQRNNQTKVIEVTLGGRR